MWAIKEYRTASSPAEAIALLRRGPGRGVYIAGGTDLLLFPPTVDFVVDVNGAGIDRIESLPDGGLSLGAAASLHAVATDPRVNAFADGALAKAAAHCGNRPVRTTATLGGNLCNALPSADMVPVLLALDAVCVIADTDSRQEVPLADFFTGPRRTVLGDRLLAAVILPAGAAGRACVFRKLTRTVEDISLVQVAVSLGVAGADGGVLDQIRIALGAVAPVPLRATRAETVLCGLTPAEADDKHLHGAAEAAAAKCAPISDHRASADYRRDMVRVLTRRLLAEALDWVRAGGGRQGAP